MSEPTKYVALGEVMDVTARRRGVIGHEGISERLWEAVRYDVSADSVFECMHGYDWPESSLMVAFREAFDLTRPEAEALAWAYSFHKLPPQPY